MGNMANRVRVYLVGWVALCFLTFPQGVGAKSNGVEAHILYVTLDEIYIDKGAGVGIGVGDVGVVTRGAAVLGRVLVTDVSQSSARMRVASSLKEPLQAGDRVTLDPQRRPVEDAPEYGSGEDFVPLLAPWKNRKPPSRARNLFHGSLRLRHLVQNDPLNQVDYTLSRADVNTVWDRIGGSPWKMILDGNVSYRDGNAFRTSPDYQEPRVDLYRAMIQRSSGQGGVFRLGRFIPTELSAVGFMDGVQAESPARKGWRWGGLAGVRPQGTEQQLSGDAPMASGYGSWEGGARGGLWAVGTAGFLTTAYKGDWDRLAFLWNQRVDLFSRSHLSLGWEEDFRVNGSTVQPQTQLTRLNVNASWSIFRPFTLKGGLDRSRRPDTLESRASLFDATQAIRDPGYWRYWVGAAQSIGWGVTFDQDVSFIDSPNSDSDPLWRWGMNSPVPGWTQSLVGFNVYNLSGTTVKGTAGNLTVYLPIDQLTLTPSCRLRYAGPPGESKDFDLVDYGLRADWRGRTWGIFGGYTRTDASITKTDLWEIGTDFRW